MSLFLLLQAKCPLWDIKGLTELMGENLLIGLLNGEQGC